MENPDYHYMKTALELAEKGAGCTSPNPMVGAVIVHDGQIIGRGWHEKAGGPHAEVNAIADAGNRARGATMYVTLEPCNHQGRTPPCTKAILEAGISRVVCAMADPNPEVAGGGARFLADRGIDVTTGICETQARRLNEFFIHYIQTRRPFVVLKSAATLDGKIATRTGDSKWVTGPAARARVHQMRNCCDAILVGVNTVTADDPSLTTRLENTTGRDAVRVILDTRLSMPGTAKMLSQKSSAPTVIAASENADPQKAAGLEKAGARILSLPEKNDRVDLEALMEKLGQMNITSLLVEGGGRVAASFLQNRLVDKICFFYAPKILGGDGMGICSGPGPQMMSSAICITDMEIEQIGDDILIQGYIK